MDRFNLKQEIINQLLAEAEVVTSPKSRIRLFMLANTLNKKRFNTHFDVIAEMVTWLSSYSE